MTSELMTRKTENNKYKDLEETISLAVFFGRMVRNGQCVAENEL